jgi:hypothetical protein
MNLEQIGPLLGAGIIGALIAFIASAFRRRRNAPAPSKSPARPPAPEKTSEQHANAQIDDAIDAVVDAAKKHNVDPGDTASDLDWIDRARADDV